MQRASFLSSKCLGSRSKSEYAALDCLHTHTGLPGTSAGTLPSHFLLRTKCSRNIPLPWRGSFLPGLLCGRHFFGLGALCWLSGSFACRKEEQFAIKIPAVEQRLFYRKRSKLHGFFNVIQMIFYFSFFKLCLQFRSIF